MLCVQNWPGTPTETSSDGPRNDRDAAIEVSSRKAPQGSSWRPVGLGKPSSVGAQNDLRYAVFPRRLVIKDGEHIEIYDTGNHRISGVAQAQSADQTLTFTSQDGLVGKRICRRLLSNNQDYLTWPMVAGVQAWRRQPGKNGQLVIRDFGLIADILGERMGCFLFQLPPSYRYTKARLNSIVSQLDPARRNVVEFRQADVNLMRLYRIMVWQARPRLHENIIPCVPGDLINFLTPIQLARMAPSGGIGTTTQRTNWRSGRSRIKASGAKRAWIYFNNDNEAHAPENATCPAADAGPHLSAAVRLDIGTWPITPAFSEVWERRMTSKSLWMDVDVMPAAGSLTGNVECDVAVIGSGIAGISTAYELCKLGMSVMVIDRGPIAGGMTSRTSAHLAPLCDDLVSEMMKIKGQEATKLFCDSQAAAIDRIEEIQKAERIDCDFRRLDGYLFQGRDMPADIIDEEMDAVRGVGAPVHRLVGVPFNGCENRHVLRYPRQATFHPLKYLAGVAKVCHDSGVSFFRDSPVEGVSQDGGVVAVKTARGTIRAQHAVVATNSSISDRFNIHTKTAPYRTYVMTFEIKRGALPDALYWDTEEPYHYVRLQPGPDRVDYVLVGGEDHKSGQADDADERFRDLKHGHASSSPD